MQWGVWKEIVIITVETSEPENGWNRRKKFSIPSVSREKGFKCITFHRPKVPDLHNLLWKWAKESANWGPARLNWLKKKPHEINDDFQSIKYNFSGKRGLMIVADKKPIEEIIDQIKGHKKILVLGCNECVTVCEAGGKKEVGILSSALRMYFLNQGSEVKIDEETLQRQCDHEYLEEIRDVMDQYDAVVSLACGVGVQFMAEKYHTTPIYPGVNTCFLGATEKRGLWTERCQACGQCILAQTGGICPVSRCAKRILNGPCGGSDHGKCEINKEVDCAWQLIVDRLKALNSLDDYEKLSPLKDWSTDRAGGPRKVIREDVQE